MIITIIFLSQARLQKCHDVNTTCIINVTRAQNSLSTTVIWSKSNIDSLGLSSLITSSLSDGVVSLCDHCDAGPSPSHSMSSWLF